MSTALARNTALKHLDIAEGERAYILAIMAEQLGIPAEDSQSVEVQALLAKAVDRNREFGWKPGVHMHVQSFMKAVKDAQNKNTGEKVRVYTLVDGEKAWKDSVMQWRIQHGVKLAYQRKPMTREELEVEVRSMGFTQAIPVNASGMWCRMIEKDDDRSDPDFPMWSTGVWFGKIKTGSYWNDDHIPTGVAPKDVAIRRADKRAMMQSAFGLLQLDRRSKEERSADLSMELQREAAHRNPTPPDTAQAQRYVVEPDGDILWAGDPEPEKRSTEPQTVDGDIEFRDGVPEEEVDGSTEEVDGTEDNPFEDNDFSPYAEIYHNPDFVLSDVTKTKIEELMGLQRESSRRMSADGYKMLRDRFYENKVLFEGGTSPPALYFFEAMTATKLLDIPGVKVGKPLIDMLSNDGDMAILKQVSIIVDTVYEESLEE